MDKLVEIYNQYKAIILLAGGLSLLAYLVYKLSEFISEETNKVVIELENKVNLTISIYEDGRTSINFSYPEHLKKVFNKKIKANGEYNEFLNSLPDEYIIEYNYEIEYITEEDTYKRTGTTMDKEELRNKIEKLIEYK